MVFEKLSQSFIEAIHDLIECSGDLVLGCLELVVTKGAVHLSIVCVYVEAETKVVQQLRQTSRVQ